MFNHFSLSTRRFALLTSCSLLLASTACQKESGVSPNPNIATSTQEAKGSKEPKNKGKFLSFASRADFLAVAQQLDKMGAGEGTENHLEKWEKKYGFNSLRAHYAKKQKEKEEREKAAAGVTTLRVPVEGEEPTVPYFEPYEEPWDEGLIIEDDYFAAMLSPEGTVEIEGKIFRIDLANNIVSYIPSTQEASYDQFVVAQPTVEGEIRYFSLTEDVFGLLEAGDQGSSFGADFRGGIRIGSGIGCGPGADRKDVKSHQYYASNRRLDCKLVYQPLGIYHSLVAKAHHQKKTWYGAWLGSPANMDIITPGVYWQPLCETYLVSDFGSYTNLYSPWYGDSNGDDNTVTHRYFNDMKGMKRYKADVYFRVGQFNTGVFHIESKW